MPKLNLQKGKEISLGSEREDFIEQFKLIAQGAKVHKKGLFKLIKRYTKFTTLEQYNKRCEQLDFELCITRTGIIKHKLRDLRTNEYIHARKEQYIYHHYDVNFFPNYYTKEEKKKIDSSDEKQSDSESTESSMNEETNSGVTFPDQSKQLGHLNPTQAVVHQFPEPILENGNYTPSKAYIAYPPVAPSNFLPVQNPQEQSALIYQQVEITYPQNGHVTQTYSDPIPEQECYVDPEQKRDHLIIDPVIPPLFFWREFSTTVV